MKKLYVSTPMSNDQFSKSTSTPDGDIQVYVTRTPEDQLRLEETKNLLLITLSTFKQQISSNFGYYQKELNRWIFMPYCPEKIDTKSSKDEEFDNCHTMETVWGLVDGQRVFNPIECKPSIFDSVSNPTHNAAKIGGSTFLIMNSFNTIKQ
jgi:hypothetical protein